MNYSRPFIYTTHSSYGAWELATFVFYFKVTDSFSAESLRRMSRPIKYNSKSRYRPKLSSQTRSIVCLVYKFILETIFRIFVFLNNMFWFQFHCYSAYYSWNNNFVYTAFKSLLYSIWYRKLIYMKAYVKKFFYIFSAAFMNSSFCTERSGGVILNKAC